MLQSGSERGNWVRYLMYFLLILVFGFLVGAVYFRIFKKDKQPVQEVNNNDSENVSAPAFVPSYVGHPPESQGGNLLANHAYVVFKSTGNVFNREAIGSTGKVVAKLSLVVGNVLNLENRSKIFVVVQSAPIDMLDTNLYGILLADSMYKLGIDQQYDGKGMLSLDELVKIFSKGSIWQAKFILDISELSNQEYFSFGSDYNKLYTDLVNEEIINLERLKNDFDVKFVGGNEATIVFPYTLSPYKI